MMMTMMTTMMMSQWLITDDGRDLTALIVTLSMTGKFAMTAAFAAVVLFAQEIYPTNVRYNTGWSKKTRPVHIFVCIF